MKPIVSKARKLLAALCLGAGVLAGWNLMGYRMSSARSCADATAQEEGNVGSPQGSPSVTGRGSIPSTTERKVPENMQRVWEALERDGTVPAKEGDRVQMSSGPALPASGSSPFERALDQLTSHDRALASAVYRRQNEFLTVPGALGCGSQEARRMGEPLILQALALIKIQCDGTTCGFADLTWAAEGSRSRLGSQAFESCMRDVAQSYTFPCPGCKRGEVEVQWPVRIAYGDVSDSDTDNWLQEELAPSRATGN